jgi:hypothetical protein
MHTIRPPLAERPPCSLILAAAALALSGAGAALGQQTYIEQPSGTYTGAGSPYPATPDAMALPGLYSQQDLDRLLAPIALYPDALLSQVLMAATHPQDVAEAARWVREHPGWSGQAAIDATFAQDWDASVSSLLNVPQVLALLDQRRDWMASLAHAFLNQEPHVLETVQALRRRAQAAGSLTPDLELGQSGNDILIGADNPQWIALPWYDPLVVYGRWWWPLAPVRWAAWPGLPRPVPAAVYLPGHRVPFARRIFQPLSTGFHPPPTHAVHLPYGRFDWQQRRLQVVHTHYVGNQAAYLSLAPWRRAPPTGAYHSPRNHTHSPAQAPVTITAGSRPAQATRAIMAAPPAAPSPAPAAIPYPVHGNRAHASPVRQDRTPGLDPVQHSPAAVHDRASRHIIGHMEPRWTRHESGPSHHGASVIPPPRPVDGVPGAGASPLAVPARPGLMAAPLAPVVRAEPPPPRHHHDPGTARPPAPVSTPSASPPSAPSPGQGQGSGQSQGHGQRRSLMR